MVAVAEILSTVSASIGLIKELNAVDRNVDEATFKLKIAELSTKLAEMQINLAELTTEISRRDQKISDLQAAMKDKIDIVEKHGAKYRSDNGDRVGNQLCRLCIQREGLFVETRDDRRNRQDVCPNCKAVYSHATKFLYPDQRTQD